MSIRLPRLLPFVIGLFLAPSASADPVGVGDIVRLSRGIGSWGAHELLLSVNGGTASFLTFSLQRGEAISFTDPLNVAGITAYATADSPSRGGNASGRDPISSQTAWLYTQFRRQTLAGYDRSPTAANRLQEAIWWFESEIPNQATNPFVIQANQAVQSGFTGIGDVRALNLFLPQGAGAQDVLTLQVPGPAPLIAVGPGLLALWLYRRRLAAARAR